MNGWYLSGIVVWKGEKRAERAPWPCMIETDGGTRDRPTVQVPVDVFGDVEVGQRVELTGFLDSREWQGRHYLQLSTKTRKVEWPGATPPPRQPDPPPPPRQEFRPPPVQFAYSRQERQYQAPPQAPQPTQQEEYNPDGDIPF